MATAVERVRAKYSVRRMVGLPSQDGSGQWAGEFAEDADCGGGKEGDDDDGDSAGVEDKVQAGVARLVVIHGSISSSWRGKTGSLCEPDGLMQDQGADGLQRDGEGGGAGGEAEVLAGHDRAPVGVAVRVSHWV